jgi:hypothetical protein
MARKNKLEEDGDEDAVEGAVAEGAHYKIMVSSIYQR